MGDTIQYKISIGEYLCSFASSVMILISVVVMIWYWNRKAYFPLKGRGKNFSFCALIGFIGVLVNFIFEGNLLHYPCGISLFTYSTLSMLVGQIYMARTTRLLFRYKLQSVVKELNRLQLEGRASSNRAKQLLNSFYVRKKYLITYRSLFIWIISVVIVSQIGLVSYSFYKTQVFSQPNQCNHVFIDDSSKSYKINSYFIMAHIPILIVLSCKLWSFPSDGFHIKHELRMFAISIAIIIPIYQLASFIPDEVSVGKWVSLATVICFVISAFLYPIFLSYHTNRIQKLDIALDRSSKSFSTNFWKRSSSFMESQSSISTSGLYENEKVEINPHTLPWKKFVGLLRTTAGHEAISEHLEQYFCSELALFLKDADEYRLDPTFEGMINIYSKYIGDDAPLEINLRANTVRAINLAIDGGNENAFVSPSMPPENMVVMQAVPDVFDPASEEVLRLIKVNMSHKFRFPAKAWKQLKNPSAKAKRLRTIHSSSPIQISTIPESIEMQCMNSSSSHVKHINDFSMPRAPHAHVKHKNDFSVTRSPVNRR